MLWWGWRRAAGLRVPSGAEAARGLAQEARFQGRHADAVRHASHALRQAPGSAELYALRWVPDAPSSPRVPRNRLTPAVSGACALAARGATCARGHTRSLRSFQYETRAVCQLSFID